MWGYCGGPLNRSFPLLSHLLFITFIDLPTPTHALPNVQEASQLYQCLSKARTGLSPEHNLLKQRSIIAMPDYALRRTSAPCMTIENFINDLPLGLVAQRGDPREIESMTAESQRN